jgi:hypothetical protein
MSEAKYLLDADSFIRSKREHYAPDFCPGFWDALLRGYRKRRVGSIVPVRKELLKGKDALADWVKDKVPDEFFESVEDDDVQEAGAEIMQWVEDNEQYTRAAKDKFVSGADPWLIAFAKVHGRTVITYEVSAPESKALIKLPDVARKFKVTCLPPYVLLRRLEVVLHLERESKT